MNAQELLERINENGRMLANDGLSELERDILLADLRDLYLLVKENITTAPVRLPSIKSARAPIILKQEEPAMVSTEEIKTPNEDETQSPISQEIPLPMTEALPVEPEEKTVIAQEKPQVETPMEDIQTPLAVNFGPVITFEERKDEKKAASLNEIFAGEEKSLNEKHSSSKKPALNDHAGRKDLKSLIDMNKQFVIINELFKGDSAAYQSAIDHINASPNVESAFEYIKTDLLPKYAWKGDMQSVRLFDKLVRQKFGV